MKGIRKFLFETDFDVHHQRREEVDVRAVAGIQVGDDPPPPQATEPPPPPPTFSEDELATAREHAYEQGHRAGLQEAEMNSNRMAALAQATIATKLGEIGKRQAEATDDIARDSVRTAIAVMRKLLPDYLRRHAADEIEALVSECVAHVLDVPRINVRVSDSIADSMRERLDLAVQQVGFEGRLLVSGDPRLPPGDCRVEWGDGGAERDGARLMAEIDAIIERATATAPTAAIKEN
ncbi:MAG: flagellar assembly protein FliH [Alphaproteobacteria bacterium]|nr:flagellar assembly protein FliH [Alphaproteobacteria bacterium]